MNPCNGVPSLGTNTFQDLANGCQLVDGELLKLADLDLEFISTNAGIKNQALNPDRALVRYQTMEVLVRIAIQKYYKSKCIRLLTLSHYRQDSSLRWRSYPEDVLGVGASFYQQV